MTHQDSAKLAMASAFFVWLNSPVPSQTVFEKMADYAPPAEGGEAQTLGGDFKAPIADVLSAIQTMIETELTTAYAYRAYAQSLRGIAREALAEEFEEHADQETDHAEYLMRRATVLGGALQLPPIQPPVGSMDPVDIVRRMVRIEQEGLAKWRLLHSLIGDSNPMKFKIEEYMTEEEEHTDDLIRMLPEGDMPSALESEVSALQAPPEGMPEKVAEDEDLYYKIPAVHGVAGAILGGVAGSHFAENKVKGGLLGATVLGGANALGAALDVRRARKDIDAPYGLSDTPTSALTKYLMRRRRAERAAEGGEKAASDITLGEAIGEPPMSPADQMLMLEQQGAEEEEEASSSYFQKRLQEQQQQTEALTQQLQQAQQQLEQTQGQLQQQTQLAQQQQQALQAATDTSARSQAAQIQLMQEGTALREQTTNTIAGFDAWKQQVMNAINSPPPGPQDPNAAPTEGANPEQPPPEPQAAPAGMAPLDAKTASVGDFMRAAGTTVRAGLKDQVGPMLSHITPAKAGVTGATALLGAVKGYRDAKNPETLLKAQQAVQVAEQKDQDQGSFLTALQLAKARASQADAEAMGKHPVMGALRGAGFGLAAGGAMVGAADEVMKLKKRFQ